MSSHFAKTFKVTRARASIAVGVVVFLTLAGTAGAQALWTTPAATVTGSAASGKLQIAQAGFPTQATSFTSSAAGLVRASEVAVTSSSTVDAPFTLSITAPADKALATGAKVQIWKKTGATCPTTAPAGTPTTSWTAVTSIADQLAPGATLTYCVRSSISLQQRYALVSESADVSTTVTAQRGENWISTVVATATQTVANTITPGAPTASGTTLTATTITWTAAADSTSVAGYYVYRNDVLVSTIPGTSTLTYTDSTLATGTAYAYTVKSYVNGTVANPATGTTPSPATPAVTVTTSGPNPSSWYTMKNGSWCVDAEASGTTNGTDVINYACNVPTSANQKWKFTPDGTGTYRIVAGHAPGSALSVDTTGNSDVTISSATSNNQRWTLLPIGTNTYQIKNVANSTRCLDIGANPSSLSNVTVRTCASPATPRQTFTLGLAG